MKHQLPPDPEGMNDRRAEWAAGCIHHFQCWTGTDFEDAVCDLLADLMHWCDRNGQDFGHELDILLTAAGDLDAAIDGATDQFDDERAALDDGCRIATAAVARASAVVGADAPDGGLAALYGRGNVLQLRLDDAVREAGRGQ